MEYQDGNTRNENVLTTSNCIQLNTFTTTLTVNCGSGPFQLSQTNGVSERFIEVINEANCTINMQSTNNGIKIEESNATIEPGRKLLSYQSPKEATQVYFTCRPDGGKDPCQLTLTISAT